MSAHVARVNPHHLRDKENSRVVMEWVKRNEALLAECEWDWTTNREEAYAWSDYECAERWIQRTRGAERERGEDRFYGAYPCTSTAPAMDIPPRRESPGGNFASSGVESRHAGPVELQAKVVRGQDGQIAISPSRGSDRPARSIQERIHDAKRNRRKAAANAEAAAAPAATPPPRRTRAPGAEAWRAIYQARVAPDEVYERTERRCGS